MTVADLVEIYEYGAWANSHLLRIAAGLSADEFTSSVAGSYGSVRNTFVHSLSAQWGWVARCGGPARGSRLNAEDFPTIDAVADLAESVHTHSATFLATLGDPDLDRIATYRTADGDASMPVGELLFHAANHAVHHRGQIALLLRESGHAPGNFDIIFFYAERRGVRPW